MPWKGNGQNSCADRSELCQWWSGTLPNALPSMVGQHSAGTFLPYRQCSRKTKLGMCSPPARLSKTALCLNSPWKWNCLIGDQWTFNIVHAPFSPHQTSLATLDSDLIKVALVFRGKEGWKREAVANMPPYIYKVLWYYGLCISDFRKGPSSA